MTDKEYYLWWDKQIQELVNPCSFLFFVFFLLTKMYIAALGFEFCNSILTNKIHSALQAHFFKRLPFGDL